MLLGALLAVGAAAIGGCVVFVLAARSISASNRRSVRLLAGLERSMVTIDALLAEDYQHHRVALVDALNKDLSKIIDAGVAQR